VPTFYSTLVTKLSNIETKIKVLVSIFVNLYTKMEQNE
jgi:hypothetical protein